MKMNVPFRLNRWIGKDRFRRLMYAGVSYIGNSRFILKDLNKIDQAKIALEEIFGKPIIFEQKCKVCEENFLCEECKFYPNCSDRDLPGTCICPKCYDKGDYAKVFV